MKTAIVAVQRFGSTFDIVHGKKPTLGRGQRRQKRNRRGRSVHQQLLAIPAYAERRKLIRVYVPELDTFVLRFVS